MLEGSEEKFMCHTSASFYVIISITWILTDTRYKNIQNRKFGYKLEFSIQHLPVPVQHVVKSFEVVIIPVLMFKTRTCRFPINL